MSDFRFPRTAREAFRDASYASAITHHRPQRTHRWVWGVLAASAVGVALLAWLR
ncbi:MAG: hypothetical protein KIH64_015040 [Mycobacterium sp.]|nr:hypothetical protein [Mycobacterium sp.]